MNTDNLFIISGPSGAGEDSIIGELKKRMDVAVVITTTTRDMRPGESQGNPYYFISQEEFDRKLANDEFVEWAQHYNDKRYGVTREELERVQKDAEVGLWKIDYKGVISAKKLFPKITAILIMADSLEVLEERIRSRGMSEDQITSRMTYTREWLKHIDIYDVTVLNRQHKLNDAVSDVEHILRKKA